MRTHLSILWSILWRAFVWFPFMTLLMFISTAASCLSCGLPVLAASIWLFNGDGNEHLRLPPGMVMVAWLGCVVTCRALRRFSIFEAHGGFNRL